MKEVIFLLNLLIFLVLMIAITALNFVLKVGGKSRIIGFTLGSGLLFFWGQQFLFEHWLVQPWAGVALIFLSILSFFLITKNALKLSNELWARIGVIFEQKTIPGTLSKVASVCLLLKLKFLSIILANHKAGRISISNYAICFPNFFHFKALIEEIFINREYAIMGLGKAPFIIDCGANIGFTTLFLKKMYPSAQFLCFEPDPTSFEFLKKNIELNKLKDVTCEQKALAVEPGVIKMSVGRHTESSTLFLGDATETALILAVKLSEYITSSVDLLKIDVEGAESQIMKDLHQSGKFALIKRMVMEYHYMEEAHNQLAQSLSFLEAWGFSYEIRVSSNFFTPYYPHRKTGKLRTLTIFACNLHLNQDVASE